jgi:hypothetical protein
MINTAPFRNSPPGLPHDPIWMMLDGRDGWPIGDPKSGSCRIALLWRIVGTVGDEAIPAGAFASPCG